MAQDLEIKEELMIPAVNLTWKAVRSQGPGGQNVNKTSTSIELRFDLENCLVLDEESKNRLRKLAGNRLLQDGTILITDSETREQGRNLERAREKLKNLILSALKKPKARRATKPSRAAQETRLLTKKKVGEKKESRRKFTGE
ncbi:MAG: aminoacyl-tRNA hydrolase [Blastocatellia bacterium]|nr:aminoacyl-tRNA hydrolase [Blastocatellia bacterium]